MPGTRTQPSWAAWSETRRGCQRTTRRPAAASSTSAAATATFKRTIRFYVPSLSATSFGKSLPQFCNPAILQFVDILRVMPFDVAADVTANRPLSADYNVLALAAPGIAAAAAPGQFVMVKLESGHDPLLRRPFSVFEVLLGPDGVPSGITLLNKRIGPSTSRLYAARPGHVAACLGPLGRPFTVVDPPGEAWMVAGGVGLAPFAALAQALCARGVASTLFYGARRADELFYLDFFRALGVE